VCCYRQGFSSQAYYFGGNRLQVRKRSTGNGNIGTGSGEAESGGFTDATTAAGYQSCLSIQREIRLCHSITPVEYLMLLGGGPHRKTNSRCNLEIASRLANTGSFTISCPRYPVGISVRETTIYIASVSRIN
jgi:hypothetical protein